MVITKSFDFILKSLKDRKKFEIESNKKFIDAKCSSCNGSIKNNGISQVSGVCNNCVSLSLRDIL